MAVKTFRSNHQPHSHLISRALARPKNPKRMWNGQDGGIAVSYDGGESWESVYNIPAGQFLPDSRDNRLPFYYILGGLQDNGAWTGPESHA